MSIGSWLGDALDVEQNVDGLRCRFQADPFESVVVDGFLADGFLEGIRSLFEQDGLWEERYVLVGDPLDMPEGSRDDWHRSGDDGRFSSQLALEGARPGHELSPGLVHHLQLQQLVGSDAFLKRLHRITGIGVSGLEGCQPRIMVAGHQMNPHTDFGNGRALCAVLYLHRDWCPSFGGRFVQYDGNGDARFVDPLPNRLVLFATSGRQRHAVEPMNINVSTWRRFTYSFWFTSEFMST